MVIVVEVEDRCFAKPFLGGWRNVLTGTEYHDAFTQTCPGDKLVYSRRRKQHRDDHPATVPSSSSSRGSDVIAKTRNGCIGKDTSVTTVVLASHSSKSTSVTREEATQTSGVPDLRDKFLTPLATKASPWTNEENESSRFSNSSGAYEFSGRQINEDGRMRCKLESDSAMKIQRCYRAYRARMDIGALARLSRETRAQTPPEPEEAVSFRRCAASEFEIINLSPPKNRSDFEMIKNVLERWRFYECTRINSGFFRTSKLAARTSILEREIELLRSIEMIKQRVRNEKKQRRYLKALEKLSEPEVWRVSSGKNCILVDTLRVQRARECRDFYRSLLDDNVSSSRRIEVLKKLRNYASLHTCQQGEDVLSLVDQEIELSRINHDEKIMNSLRNRLSLALWRLTMNFCAPKKKIATDGTRKIRLGAKTKKLAFSKLCKRCGKFLTVEDLSARIATPSSELLPTCKNCEMIQPATEAQISYEPYEIMLRDLRMRETDLGSSAKSGSPAWIVDSRIIYRLVNYVWHGKSGISGCDDPYRLLLVRFRSDREWAPWNNVVLTKREAALHQAMADPGEIYAPTIMKQFVVKNLQAKLRLDLGTRVNS